MKERKAREDSIDVTAMSETKDFIASIEDGAMREDVEALHALVTRHAPSLAPTTEFIKSNTLGYGKYHYRYKSGREGDWYKVGISCSNKSAKTKSISLHCCALVKGKYIVEDFTSKQNIGKTISVGRVVFDSRD